MIATRADLTDIAVSQALFHISMLLPPFLYWVCRTPDADPRFPATISWTIRRGDCSRAKQSRRGTFLTVAVS